MVLVTGGSKGIGAASPSGWRRAGHRVAATYRSGEVPPVCSACSATSPTPAQVDAAFAQVERSLGNVEVVVANAGITRDTLLMRMSDEDWDAVIATNLTGAFRVARRAARPMMRARFGRIIFISSVVGLLGSAGQVNYAASKAGLVGMARSLARELGSRGITANVVAPGFIETDMTAALGEDQVKTLPRADPAGRLGAVDDIAAAVEFLVGDAAGYITGARDPGGRRPRHGPLIARRIRLHPPRQPPTRDRLNADKDCRGNPRRQEHPGRRRHAGHLDRLPRRQDRPGRGRHGDRVELRPGDEPDRPGDQEAGPGAAAARGRRDQRGASRRAGRPAREHVDCLDGLVHSLAFANPETALGGKFLSTPWADVATALQVSAFSLASLTMACKPLLADAASVVGLTFDATVSWPVYDWMGVSKSALESTSRYLARYLGPEGIRVNLVAAGPLETLAKRAIGGAEEFNEVWGQRAPIGWDPKDMEPDGQGAWSRCSATSSPRPPAR